MPSSSSECSCPCCKRNLEQQNHFLQELQDNYEQLRILSSERDHYKRLCLSDSSDLKSYKNCPQCKELLDDCYILREKLIAKNDELRNYSMQLDTALSQLDTFKTELETVQLESSLPYLSSFSSSLQSLSRQVHSLESLILKSPSQVDEARTIKTLSKLSKEMGGMSDVIYWCAQTIETLLVNQSPQPSTSPNPLDRMTDDDIVAAEVKRIQGAFDEVGLDFPLVKQGDGYFLGKRKLLLSVSRTAPTEAERVLVRSGGGFLSLVEFLKNSRIFTKKVM
ncbi:hypothetical protein GEMRC1_002667 [Eukaryota sp. GEM-RC1]